MVRKEELKDVDVLTFLSDDMIEKLVREIKTSRFAEGDVIFKEGDDALCFYVLKWGKVLLEKKLSDNLSIYTGEIKPGSAFGWSGFLDEGSYTLDASCAEECEVFYIERKTIRRLLDEDHSMGYLFSQSVLRVVIDRLDYRTEQLLRIVTDHPDIKTLVED